MTTVDPSVKIEIVGLFEGGHGRSCDNHDVCGEIVTLNKILRLRSVVITNDQGKKENAVAAYARHGGKGDCRVGFLRKFAVKHRRYYHNKLVKVVELLSESAILAVRKRSHAMRGSCYGFLII